MEEWAILFKNRVITRFTINEGQCLVIGRGKEADVIIPNTAVSRRHSSLELRDGVYYLADLRSMNGTRVNGRKVRSAIPIEKSDNLHIGKFTLKPVKELEKEVEIRPAASVAKNYEDGDMTRYVSGIYNKTDLRKKKAAPKNRELHVLEGNVAPTRLALKGKGIKVGTDRACDLVLSGFFMGKVQFTIICRQDSYIITHESGLRKTWVNGKKLTRSRVLTPLDVIQVGGIKIRFV